MDDKFIILFPSFHDDSEVGAAALEHSLFLQWTGKNNSL